MRATLVVISDILRVHTNPEVKTADMVGLAMILTPKTFKFGIKMEYLMQKTVLLKMVQL